MQSFSQQRIIFTALQPIRAGTEITISYIELAATRSERRQQLLAQYYFDIDHDLQGGHAESVLQCQSGPDAFSAELFQSAPGHMDPADYELTAVRLISAETPMQAHLMAFSKTQEEPAEQESFPYGGSADLDEGDDEAASSSQQAPAGLASPAGRQRGGEAGEAGQHLVHTQCWGQGWQGMSERHLSAIGHHMSRLLSQHSQCLAALQSHRPAEAKKLAEAALQSADRLPGPAKALGPRHIWRVRLCEALMRACIDVGNQWQEALAVGLQLVPAYEMIYPKVWPNKGLHYATMAKIAAFLEHDATAAEYANKALQQLQYTHATSPVLEEIRQIAFEASRSQDFLA